MVDIVIVNWNSGEYLKKCIHSILSSNNKDFINRVIVIDNNSTDTSLKIITASDKIDLIINETNIGFSRACNQGFKQCTAEFILLLNPDAMLLDNTIKDSIDCMQQDKSIDILGCRLLGDNGKISASCSRFPSPTRIFFDASGLSKILPRYFKPATIMTDWNHLESKFVNQVMGAFMFMKTSIFEKVGYFDERFFVYYEEVDFSKRISIAGGHIFYNTSITAIHSGEGTTQSVKGFRLFLSLRSRLQYAKKHFSFWGQQSVWFSTFFIEPFTRVTLLIARGKIKEIKEVINGYTLLIKNAKP